MSALASLAEKEQQAVLAVAASSSPGFVSAARQKAILCQSRQCLEESVAEQRQVVASLSLEALCKDWQYFAVRGWSCKRWPIG